MYRALVALILSIEFLSRRSYFVYGDKLSCNIKADENLHFLTGKTGRLEPLTFPTFQLLMSIYENPYVSPIPHPDLQQLIDNVKITFAEDIPKELLETKEQQFRKMIKNGLANRTNHEMLRRILEDLPGFSI